MSLSYPIIIKHSDEGFAVGCPALPGCWSQGQTEEEAIDNIKIAIKEYLEAVRETLRGQDIKEIEVELSV